MKVTLTAAERDQAIQHAKRVIADSGRRQLRNAHGLKADSLTGDQLTILGTLGEWAAAKGLGKPFPTGNISNFGGADLPPNIGVRTVDSPDKRLWIRSADPSRFYYVLVLALGHGKFELRGYIRGGDAKDQPRWLNDAKNGRELVWWVPVPALRPVHELLADTGLTDDAPAPARVPKSVGQTDWEPVVTVDAINWGWSYDR